jgi:phospholipase A1/A2
LPGGVSATTIICPKEDRETTGVATQGKPAKKTRRRMARTETRMPKRNRRMSFLRHLRASGTGVLMMLAATTGYPGPAHADRAILQSGWQTAAPVVDEKKTIQPLGQAGRPFDRNFVGHEPIYFLFGADPRDAKFQLSFAYRFFNTEGELANRWNWLTRLHLGYTQTSFWDLESDSKPFTDSSYKPELFYAKRDIEQSLAGWLSRLDFQAGLQHESNGRDGQDSRTINIFYIKPGFLFGTQENYSFSAIPKMWIYLGDLSENQDLADYRGYCALLLKFGKPDGFQISSNLRKGTAAGKGSFQFDMTYPLNRILFQNLDLYLQLQYFTGYGENLLDYDQNETHWRIGFSVLR